MTREELAQFIGQLQPNEQADLYDLMINDGIQDMEMRPVNQDHVRQAEDYGMLFNNASRYELPQEKIINPIQEMRPVAGGKPIPEQNPSIAAAMKRMNKQRSDKLLKQEKGPIDDSDPDTYSTNFVVEGA